MCRFVVHTMLEIPEERLLLIEAILAELAIKDLGSVPEDVEVYWPKERIGLNAAKITIDAEFTVGIGVGDIRLNQRNFEFFAKVLLTFLKRNNAFDTVLNKDDHVAAWVKPDQRKSVWLSGYRR